MSKTKKGSSKTVSGMIAKAVVDMEAASSPGNFMNIATSADGTKIILTTVIGDKPLAWIQFDAVQIDNLMAMLESHRAAMK